MKLYLNKIMIFNKKNEEKYDISDLKKHIYVVPVEQSYKLECIQMLYEVKAEVAEKIITFAIQFKKVNAIKKLLNHIESHISKEHKAQQECLSSSNIILAHSIQVDPLGRPLVDLLGKVIYDNDGLEESSSTINAILNSDANTPKEYFEQVYYDSIINVYNTLNDSWVCPYEYSLLLINLQSIKNICQNERLVLHTVSSDCRTILSKYIKLKFYKHLIASILVKI